jgi:hypothetical protein
MDWHVWCSVEGEGYIDKAVQFERNLFCFLSPLKKRRNPAHKTTHLQTAASHPCKPKFAKELFFCQRITTNLKGNWYF